MKKNELAGLRAKGKEEAKKELSRKKKELALLMSEMGRGKHKNMRAAKNLRKDIAQLLTVLKENKLEGKVKTDENI